MMGRYRAVISRYANIHKDTASNRDKANCNSYAKCKILMKGAKNVLSNLSAKACAVRQTKLVNYRTLDQLHMINFYVKFTKCQFIARDQLSMTSQQTVVIVTNVNDIFSKLLR